MTNPYVTAMLPALPVPLEQLEAEELAVYVEGLDQLSRTPGPIGEAALARAEELRPTAVARTEERARLPDRDRNVGPQ